MSAPLLAVSRRHRRGFVQSQLDRLTAEGEGPRWLRRRTAKQVSQNFFDSCMRHGPKPRPLPLHVKVAKATAPAREVFERLLPAAKKAWTKVQIWFRRKSP